jgi:hypothetical protein
LLCFALLCFALLCFASLHCIFDDSPTPSLRSSNNNVTYTRLGTCILMGHRRWQHYADVHRTKQNDTKSRTSQEENSAGMDKEFCSERNVFYCERRKLKYFNLRTNTV